MATFTTGQMTQGQRRGSLPGNADYYIMWYLSPSARQKAWTRLNSGQWKNASQKVLLCHCRMSIFVGANYIYSLVVNAYIITSLEYLT